jgi:hypothetical protein
MLDSYIGQNVIVVGKVMQLRGESAVLDANGEVNAILNRVRYFPIMGRHSLTEVMS